MRINTLVIFGTRPEAIKMAPVIQRLDADRRFNNKICITGQHQQMLSPVLDWFQIKPDFNLNVMTESQELSGLSARILTGLSHVFNQCKPDVILVHGDTTTTLSAALASYYRQIPVAHVEAGLRTGDINLPWPEEGNRKVTAALSTWHFAPTSSARNNLLNEGISPEHIFVTGNTVIDALYDTANKINNSPVLKERLAQQFSFLSSQRKFILVTGHRRENFGHGFERICKALEKIAIRFPDVDILYPVHLNPSVHKPVRSLLGSMSNIYLIDPVDYLSFVYLMQRSWLILTDSGGVQEEAPSLGKPVLVMRDKTERPEAVDAGTVILVGTQVDEIVDHVVQLLTDKSRYQRMSHAQNPYGDGESAYRITQILGEKMAAKHRVSDKKVSEESVG